MLGFDGLILYPRNEQLWRDGVQIALKPKGLAVLRYLAEHPGRLITKRELLDALWGDVNVADGALKSQLRDVRMALEDDARSPRVIETVHGRGYRFVAAVEQIGVAAVTANGIPAAAQNTHVQHFVGRELELARLNDCLERALTGALQLVFVTGEAGMGKTALTSVFLETQASRAGLWIARGQCIEHSGTVEAYLPWLEALERLSRQHRGVGDIPANPPLRELAEGILSITEQQPLLLLLEDLHWADDSTLRLLRYLMRRGDRARLLIVATCRPRAMESYQQPFSDSFGELRLCSRSEELPLSYLNQRSVSEYLGARLPGHALPGELARVLKQRTGGNPLLLTCLVEDWVRREYLLARDGEWQLGAPLRELERALPEGLAWALQRELDQLAPFERSVLEAASVIGTTFSLRTVASALEADLARVEEVCNRWLRRRQFLQRASDPEHSHDGPSLRCSFQHGLYQQIARASICTTRLSRLQLRVQLAPERQLTRGLAVAELSARYCPPLHQQSTWDIASGQLDRSGHASKAALGD